MDCHMKQKQVAEMRSCCVVCDAAAKYKCPACARRTCSVQCCHKHRLQFSCSGIARTVSFKSLGNFTDQDILSDYRHLERIAREVASVRENRISTSSRAPACQMHRLRRAAFKHDCRLQFAPSCFVRHRLNTSHVDPASKLIHWKLDIVLPCHDISLCCENVREDGRLRHVIVDMLRNEARATDTTQCDGPDLTDNPVMLYLAAAETRSLCAFIKHSSRSSSPGSNFKQVGLSWTLRAALRGTCIVEFPSLFVVTAPNTTMFTQLRLTGRVTSRGVVEGGRAMQHTRCPSYITGGKSNTGSTGYQAVCPAQNEPPISEHNEQRLSGCDIDRVNTDRLPRPQLDHVLCCSIASSSVDGILCEKGDVIRDGDVNTTRVVCESAQLNEDELKHKSCHREQSCQDKNTSQCSSMGFGLFGADLSSDPDEA